MKFDLDLCQSNPSQPFSLWVRWRAGRDGSTRTGPGAARRVNVANLRAGCCWFKSLHWSAEKVSDHNEGRATFVYFRQSEISHMKLHSFVSVSALRPLPLSPWDWASLKLSSVDKIIQVKGSVFESSIQFSNTSESWTYTELSLLTCLSLSSPVCLSSCCSGVSRLTVWCCCHMKMKRNEIRIRRLKTFLHFAVAAALFSEPVRKDNIQPWCCFPSTYHWRPLSENEVWYTSNTSPVVVGSQCSRLPLFPHPFYTSSSGSISSHAYLSHCSAV